MVSVIADIATACGFLILIYQVWTGLRLMKNSMTGSLYSELHETHRVFIEHPLLRPVFYHKEAMDITAPVSGEEEKYYRARAVAEMFFDVFEHIYILRSELTSETFGPVAFSAGDVAGNWDNYIDDMLSGSSFLAAYMYEVRDNIHPPQLRDYVLHSIARHWPDIANSAETIGDQTPTTKTQPVSA